MLALVRWMLEYISHFTKVEQLLEQYRLLSQRKPIIAALIA